jgi:hypothetical protein
MWQNRYADDRDPDGSMDFLDKIISVAKSHSATVFRDQIYIRDKEANIIETASSEGKDLISPELLFTDEVRNIVQFAFGAGGAAGCLKIVKDMAVAFLNNRASRSMTLKKGEMSITIQGSSATPKQVEHLIALLDKAPADGPNAEVRQPDSPVRRLTEFPTGS